MEEALGQLLFALLNGLVWGLILALVALGLSLIYGNLRLLNFAHGSFYMLGAMLGWKLQSITGFWPALMISPVISGSLGMASERLFLRSLQNQHLVILTSIGLMIILQQSATIVFGSSAHAIDNPIPGTIALFTRNFPIYWLFVGAISASLIVGFWFFTTRSRMGIWLRATGQDPILASSSGIPVPHIKTLAFGVGTALAAAAGVLVAPILGLHPLMGLEILVLALIIVIIGGGPWGSVGIAIGMSELENLLPLFMTQVAGISFSPTLSRVLILSLLIAILFIRSHRSELKEAL
jgi:branched-chain amino acid transport system permease protein